MIAFLVVVGIRSTGLVPSAVVSATTTFDVLILTAALAGLGMAVDVRRLRRLGARPLLLGFISWMLIAGISLGLVLLFY